jgi:hypothetical protein
MIYQDLTKLLKSSTAKTAKSKCSFLKIHGRMKVSRLCSGLLTVMKETLMHLLKSNFENVINIGSALKIKSFKARLTIFINISVLMQIKRTSRLRHPSIGTPAAVCKKMSPSQLKIFLEKALKKVEAKSNIPIQATVS